MGTWALGEGPPRRAAIASLWTERRYRGIRAIAVPIGLLMPAAFAWRTHHSLILRGHRGHVISVAFSPDGTRLVTASRDNTARLWDGRNGTPLAVLQGHGDWVVNVEFS